MFSSLHKTLNTVLFVFFNTSLV